MLNFFFGFMVGAAIVSILYWFVCEVQLEKYLNRLERGDDE